MKGKYSNPLLYWIYKAYRSTRRYQLSDIVDWNTVDPACSLEPGCTILLGMCSKLPKVIYANLSALQRTIWNDLKAVYIIVDCQKCDLEPGTEEKVIQAFPGLNISFFYYSEYQSKQAEQLKLPYLYSWLSWCIGLKHTKTQTVLIHDYDALIVSQTALQRRYQEFQSQQAKIQGIEWYSNNGFLPSDRLACTFECFVDVAWLRSFRPIELFNHMGIYKGRTVDYDSLLEIQALHLAPEERAISKMSQAKSEIVHPSQMIHQYTMFRKFPGRSLPCYSMILLPLFNFLAGDRAAFKIAKSAVLEGNGNMVWDGVVINLNQLEDHHLHWGLQQSVQALVSFDIDPLKDLFDYYRALSGVVGCPLKHIQHEHAEPSHQRWFSEAQHAFS